MVAHRAEPLDEVIAVRQHGAPLPRRDQLGGVERQRRHVGERADGPAAVRAAEGVRRVGDDGPAVLARERQQPVVLTGQAGEVHGQDSARARRRGALHRIGIEVQRGGVDVGEHGPGTLVDDGVRGRGEGQGRRDRLVAGPEPGRPARRVQRRRAVGEGHSVLHTRAVGKRALEEGERRSLGDQVRGERLAHCGGVARVDRVARIRQERRPDGRAP